MAIDGGGGGGGILGFSNSFTGTAQSIDIYGEHAAAYSGQFAATTSAQTALNFTSGNYYFVGQFALYGAIDPTSPGGSRSSSSGLLSFNGSNLLTLATGEGTKRFTNNC